MRRSTTIAGLCTLVALAGCSGSDGDSASATTGSGPDDTTAVTGVVLAPPDAPPLDQLSTDAILTVVLEDISLADVPATKISWQRLELADEGLPASFALPYDEVDIEERNTYRVTANVVVHGDLQMISDTVIPVITRGAPTSDVEVPLVLIASN